MAAQEERTVHPRTLRYRERILNTKRGIATARLVAYTEAYREFQSDEIDIIRAKAMRKLLCGMPIAIHEDELIAGNVTERPPRCGPITPDYSLDWVKDIDTLATRSTDPLFMTDDDIRLVKEIAKEWEGRTLSEKFRAAVPAEYQETLGKLYFTTVGVVAGRGHASLDWRTLLERGLGGIKAEADEKIAAIDTCDALEYEKLHFYKAVSILCGASIEFAHRYAALAEKMAAEPGVSEERRRELLNMAEMCSHVPEKPARNFQEAIQSIWLAHIVLFNEDVNYGLVPGRLDQHLYPYYKKDLESGFMTRDRAMELIEQFYLKLNEHQLVLGNSATQFYAGQAMAFNLVLGGMKRDGTDGTNELTYLFLDAELNVCLPAPDIMIRVCADSPQEFLYRACSLAIERVGKCKFLMDKTAIELLKSRGVEEVDARDYTLVGCMEPFVEGMDNIVVDGQINLAKCMELALNDGTDPMTGEKIGLSTGPVSGFATFDDLFNAFVKQLAEAVRKFVGMRNIALQLNAKYTPASLQSALTQGCMESGRDLMDGGSIYKSRCVNMAGAVNVGDSFSVIKKLVYEDKYCTLEDIKAAISADFTGYDDLLARINAVPKYGNDIDEPDFMVKRVTDAYIAEVEKYHDHRGAPYTVAFASITSNIPYGRQVGATPDGRKAGMPLGEGGISPYQGRNVSGAIATLKSAVKLDLKNARNGSVLNLRFSPSSVDTEEKVIKFTNLIRAYHEINGYLVQFNFVDSETLLAAQADPDSYRDLTVRVATYSALFTELSKALQDDIIARTIMEEI